MGYTLNCEKWKRFFSVPCALIDNYLKLVGGAELKVILYLMANEEPDISAETVINATGISREAFDDAIEFWKSLGVISTEADIGQINTSVPTEQHLPKDIPPVELSAQKIVHTMYSPKDIADMLVSSAGLKELFTEAEKTLGRILKHSDHETLISLRDYYGFSEQSIVLILGYCAGLGKTSAKYIEAVAKDLFSKGMNDFHSIESEFERLNELHSFESEIKRGFGLSANLTPKQRDYINSWRNMGFGGDMILFAGEKCVDATNNISFPYINKILTSWNEKNIKDIEAAKNEVNPKKEAVERSFNLDEFDSFTLGIYKETQ